MGHYEELLRKSAYRPKWDSSRFDAISRVADVTSSTMKGASANLGWEGKSASDASHKFDVEGSRFSDNSERISSVAKVIDNANGLLDYARDAYESIQSIGLSAADRALVVAGGSVLLPGLGTILSVAGIGAAEAALAQKREQEAKKAVDFLGTATQRIADSIQERITELWVPDDSSIEFETGGTPPPDYDYPDPSDRGTTGGATGPGSTGVGGIGGVTPGGGLPGGIGSGVGGSGGGSGGSGSGGSGSAWPPIQTLPGVMPPGYPPPGFEWDPESPYYPDGPSVDDGSTGSGGGTTGGGMGGGLGGAGGGILGGAAGAGAVAGAAKLGAGGLGVLAGGAGGLGAGGIGGIGGFGAAGMGGTSGSGAAGAGMRAGLPGAGAGAGGAGTAGAGGAGARGGMGMMGGGAPGGGGSSEKKDKGLRGLIAPKLEEEEKFVQPKAGAGSRLPGDPAVVEAERRMREHEARVRREKQRNTR